MLLCYKSNINASAPVHLLLFILEASQLYGPLSEIIIGEITTRGLFSTSCASISSGSCIFSGWLDLNSDKQQDALGSS